jgi:hypothetical protein
MNIDKNYILIFDDVIQGWPSGQWQQTVNLSGFPYQGSNP